MTSPMLTTPTLQQQQQQQQQQHHHQDSEYLPSISPSVVYSTAHAMWSAQELQLLHKGLAEFPADSYDSVTRYIKIAAIIPNKCVRDVAFRVQAMTMEVEAGREMQAKRMRIDHTMELANMASQKPLDEAQLNVLLQENVHSINVFRNNLINGKANDNKDVMLKFRDNCQTIMTAIGDICSTIPPLPIKLDTSLLADQ